MNSRLKHIINTIVPNKKINYFSLFIITLGIISGSIFLVLINQNDKSTVVTQITNFILNINNNNLNNVQALKNSLLINFVYIMLIWVLGMSLIGILINIFIIYIKGFVIGFSISSIIYVYGLKGILASFVYIFPHQIMNLLVVLLLGIYSIMFTVNIYKLIIGDKNIEIRSFFKKYFYILVISIIITIISSLIESFLTPALFKIIIELLI